MNIPRLAKSVNELGGRVRPTIDAAKRRLESVNERTTSLIKDHPAACLLGALVLGYVVARIARRQS
jgi:hypothetical protein